MDRKLKRTDSVLWTSILWGAAMSFLVTLSGCGIIASLVLGERIEESTIGYAIMPMMILASYAGSYIGCKKANKQRLMISLLVGCVYLAVLLSMNAMLFSGKYQAIGETLLLVMCGCILCAMWTSRGKTGNRGKKWKIPNR